MTFISPERRQRIKEQSKKVADYLSKQYPDYLVFTSFPMTDILDPDYESDLTEEEHNQLVLMSEHAVARPLSPAARQVFEAFNSKFDWIEDGVPGPQFSALAAALYAAADQVVPVPIKADTPERHWALLGVKHRLLAIADELRGQ